jgi:hypothetical protein
MPFHHITCENVFPLGRCLSLDNTFKVAKKATVVDHQKARTQVMKGGILSVINEKNEILAWVCVTRESSGDH